VIEKDVSQAEERSRTSGDELASSLLRHDIRVESETVAQDDLSVANRILERSHRTYQDLIVMGIYGHSRLREFVLGGVSRDILQHASVPILIAH
jgi:nucleotide-binding universal stress UspA family protein